MNEPRKLRTHRIIEDCLIAVVRAPRADLVPRVCESLIAGGIRLIEITLSTPGAIQAIADASYHFGREALIGVGTVLDTTAAARAIEAGAEFLVSPVLKPALVSVGHEAGRPVMLGAYTPTEAQSAHEAGADFIKIFPAETLGAAYLRALRAPLPHLRLVPTGGVDLETLPGLLKAGCSALGVGSALVSADLLKREDWHALRLRAEAFSTKLLEVRSTLSRTP